MGVQDESPEDYAARARDADEITVARKGKKPDYNDGNQAMLVGFIAGTSSMIALAIAGNIGERADWAVVIVSLGAAAVNYVYRQWYAKKWHEAWQKRMQETQPKG